MHKRIKIILNWAISEHTAGPIVNCHVIWPKDDFVLNKPEFNTIINLQCNFTQAFLSMTLSYFQLMRILISKWKITLYTIYFVGICCAKTVWSKCCALPGVGPKTIIFILSQRQNLFSLRQKCEEHAKFCNFTRI